MGIFINTDVSAREWLRANAQWVPLGGPASPMPGYTLVALYSRRDHERAEVAFNSTKAKQLFELSGVAWFSCKSADLFSVTTPRSVLESMFRNYA